MTVANLLHDEGEINEVRAALFKMKAALNIAAYDYAHGALGEAQTACEAALAAEPCSVVFFHTAEYQRLARKAHVAMDACLSATGMLLEVEETGEPSIDNANARVKVDSVEKHVVSSMLEGAESRINVVQATLPDVPAPGARCVPEKLNQ